MTITGPAAEVDPDKVMQFVFRAVDEAGATLNPALVVLGDKLGYYRVLAAEGAATAAGLAERSGTAEPYAREWLNAQAAGGYVTYDPGTGPAFLPCLFQIALGTVTDTAAVLDAARNGSGVGWHEHNTRRARRLRTLLPAELPHAGRSGPAARRDRGRRVHPLRASRRDTVQPGARRAPVGAH